LVTHGNPLGTEREQNIQKEEFSTLSPSGILDKG